VGPVVIARDACGRTFSRSVRSTIALAVQVVWSLLAGRARPVASGQSAGMSRLRRAADARVRRVAGKRVPAFRSRRGYWHRVL